MSCAPVFPSMELETRPLVWTSHSVGVQTVLRTEIDLPTSPDLWAALESEDSWAFYWKSRQGKGLEWGLGAALLLGRDGFGDVLRESGLRFFGGAPFDVLGDRDDVWGELREELWVLPEIHGQILDEGVRVSFHVVTSPDQNEKDYSREFYKKLRSIFSLRGKELAPLPLFATRLENPSQERWTQQVEKAHLAIRSDVLEKVVLSRCVQLGFHTKLSWVECLRSLLDLDEESYVFAIRTPSRRVFMGRSPERLLAWDASSFQIDAIAGTRRREEGSQQDLLIGHELQASKKDKWEHSLVRLAVEELIQDFARAYELVSDQELLRLQYVQHIRTRFKGEWRDGARGLELLQALHPTPAVGGSPTLRAIEFIREHEDYARGWFAGYIGTISADSAELAIGIRSALLYDQTLRIFAGAGIVWGSDPSEEWFETELKMQNFLQLFSPEMHTIESMAEARQGVERES